jgi:hypothetical protein
MGQDEEIPFTVARLVQVEVEEVVVGIVTQFVFVLVDVPVYVVVKVVDVRVVEIVLV